jgi:uncharacterized membrane protein
MRKGPRPFVVLALLLFFFIEPLNSRALSTVSNSNERINFASSRHLIDYPDFLEIQLKSFQEFFQLDTTPEDRATEGLYKVRWQH